MRSYRSKNLPHGAKLKGTKGGKRIILMSCPVWEKLKVLSKEISPMWLQIQIENLRSPRLVQKVGKSIYDGFCIVDLVEIFPMKFYVIQLDTQIKSYCPMKLAH
jgi:hypothetical protein